MVLPAEASKPRPVLSDRDEMRLQARVETARNEAKDKAARDTKTTGENANGPIDSYNKKVRDHQREWVRQNGHDYRSQKALQAGWEAAWKRDGEGAEKELQPYIEAYDLAVQTDLRLAASESPEALKARLKQIKDLDRSGSRTDMALDGLASSEAEQIGRETPELRTAAQNYVTASAGWQKLEGNPANPGYEHAKSTFEAAHAEHVRQLSIFFDGKIQKGLDAGKSLDQVTGELKKSYGGQFDSIIDFQGNVRRNGEKIADWLDAYRADPGKTPLTEAERKLLDKDRTTLAFLKLSGITIDPAKLSAEERQLAETSPILFGLLQKGGVHIEAGVDAPIVEINGQAIELTAQNRAAYQKGGLVGLGLSLRQSGQVKANPAMEMLLLGTSTVRADLTTDRVNALMAAGRDIEAMAALKASMDAALSPDERSTILTKAGLPHFGPGTGYWETQIAIQIAKPGDTSQSRFGDWIADRVGRWMQDVAHNAPAELADDMLGAVKEEYRPEWLKGNGSAGTASRDGIDFYKGLSLSVEVADQIGGNDRTQEFAKLVAGMPVGENNLLMKLWSEGGGAPIRMTIEQGYGAGLSNAIVNEYTNNAGAYDEKLVHVLGRDLPGIVSAGGQADWLKEAKAQYAAFQDNKTEMLQSFFDRFGKIPNLGVQISTKDSPELRNAIGAALGLTPNKNVEAAQGGNNHVDWYAAGSKEWQLITFGVSLIDNQDDDKSQVTFVPTVYVSPIAGVQNGALFRITKSDGSEVVIDGSQIDDIWQKAQVEQRIIDPDDPAEGAQTKWHFTGLDDFIDHNEYDTNGKIYLPKDWRLTDLDNDHHIDWEEHDAARTTGRERVESIIDAGAMIVGTAAGLALAPVTAGGSLLAMAAVWTAIGASTAWQVYRAHEMREDMSAHGESTDRSNPAARDTYLQESAAFFALLPMGATGRALSLVKSGSHLKAVGEVARDTNLLARGGMVIASGERYAQLAKYSGFVNAVTGMYFIGQQSYALATNLAVMSTGQILTSGAYLLFGAGQFGVGAAAARMPRLAKKLAANPKPTPEQQKHLQSVLAARIASDTDALLAPEFGSYVRLPGGEIRAVPSVGKPVTIYPAQEGMPPVPAVEMPQFAFDGQFYGRQHHSGEPLIIPGQGEPPAAGTRLVVPGQAPAHTGRPPRIVIPGQHQESAGPIIIPGEESVHGSHLFLPGEQQPHSVKTGKEQLWVLPHPADDSMGAGAFMRSVAAGHRVDVIDLTSGDGGTQFTTESGIPRPKYAATGKEATDPGAYRRIRVSEQRNFFRLLGAPDDLSVTLLGMPDVNPFPIPGQRTTRYADLAQWDRPAIVGHLVERIAAGDYDVLLTTWVDPSGHPAHQEGYRLLTEATAAYEALSGRKAPPIVAIRERGWYGAQKQLQPIPPERLITLKLSPSELARKKAALEEAYDSQPPGHPEYYGNAREMEEFVIGEGATPEQVAALRDWFAPAYSRSRPRLIQQKHPLVSEVEELALPASGVTPTRVETVPPPPGLERPDWVGPESVADLAAMTARAVAARTGQGRQPRQITDAEEAQWMYLSQAEGRYVPDRPTLRQRASLIRGEDGNFWTGYRRDAVIFISSDKPPHEVFGPGGTGLELTGETRAWTTLDGAREASAQQLALPENAGRVRYVYRTTASHRELTAVANDRYAAPEFVESALVVFKDNGALFHETAVNRNALYAPKPGEVYTAPTKRGLTGKEFRRASYKTAGAIALSAAGTYAGVRWGITGGQHLDARDWLVTTGLAMFGYRAAAGGVKEMVKLRLSRRLEPIGENPRHSELETVQRQTVGLRRMARGITRARGDELALSGAMLRANPKDSDAFRNLDGAPDAVFAPESPLGKGLEVLKLASYGVNDAAGSRVLTNLWLDPQSNMLVVSFRDLASSAGSFENIATVGFVPVHWIANASSLWPRFLATQASRQHGDTIAQARGARRRGYYQGNDDRGGFLQYLQGLGAPKGVTYPRNLPNGTRIQKAPLPARLQEHAMAGATLISLPFMAQDWTHAAQAFASGHPVIGFIEMGKGAADYMFMRAFQQSYVDAFRANRGLGETRRHNRFADWLNAPLKGATEKPSDITQPRLLKRGFLKTFAPAFVLALGMNGRVRSAARGGVRAIGACPRQPVGRNQHRPTDRG